MTTPPTAEDWRALARSAPWLWDRLDAVMSHLPGAALTPHTGPWRVRYRGVRGIDEPHVTDEDGTVLATSPRVLAAFGGIASDGGSASDGFASDGGSASDGGDGAHPASSSPEEAGPATDDRWGPPSQGAVAWMAFGESATPAQMEEAHRDVERERRASWDAVHRRVDGLVERRPFFGPPDPPFFQDYHVVAMLDPAELADGEDPEEGPPTEDEPLVPGTNAWDVRAGEVGGRPVWWAKVAPTRDYRARCGCCALILDTAGAVAEWGEEWARDNGYVGPASDPHHAEVALDRGAGIVVRLRIVGGPNDGDEYAIDIAEAVPPVS